MSRLAGVGSRFVTLVAILVVGAYLRFSALREKSLWLDEAISARYLDFSISDTILRSADPHSVHPPLFFLILRPWSWLWGESEFALHSLAASCGTLMIVGTYLLVRELASFPGEEAAVSAEESSLLAAALVSLSPMEIELSQIVRGYTLAGLLLTLSGLAIVLALRDARRVGVYWFMAALLAVGLLYPLPCHPICRLPGIVRGRFPVSAQTGRLRGTSAPLRRFEMLHPT